MTNTKTSRGFGVPLVLEKLKLPLIISDAVFVGDKPMVYVNVPETSPWMSFVKESEYAHARGVDVSSSFKHG